MIHSAWRNSAWRMMITLLIMSSWRHDQQCLMINTRMIMVQDPHLLSRHVVWDALATCSHLPPNA